MAVHKGFAHRLGYGLGSVVAGARRLELRVLEKASGTCAPIRWMIKLLVLVAKLGVFAAVGLMLFQVFSWLVSSLVILGIILFSRWLLPSVGIGSDESGYQYGCQGYGYYVNGCRIGNEDD